MRVKLKHRCLARRLAESPMSLNRWAQRMGLGRGHLSDLVNGKRVYVTGKTRQKLLDGTGLEFDELFEVEHPPKPPQANIQRPPRARRGDSIMGSLWNDLRFAFRSLMGKPGFTTAATLTLAVGIAANTTLFSFVNSVLVKPLPYENPNELVSIYGASEMSGRLDSLSYPDFVDLRASLTKTGLASIAVHDWEPFAVSDGETAIRVGGGRVSANLFDVIGVRAILGRTFHADEDEPGADPVVVLSEQLWRSHFGEDPDIVGRTIIVNGSRRIVIGVIPASGAFPELTRIWTTLADYPARDARAAHGLQSTARLDPGTGLAAARASLQPIAAQLQELYPDSNEDRGLTILALRDQYAGDMRVLSMTLLAVVAFVLLIVCANVANLLLAHGVSRGREIAVRSALGASRAQLVRLLLSESLVLGAMGCVSGLLVGYFGVRALPLLIPVEIPAWVDQSVDLTVVLYTVFVSTLAAIVFGLAPALTSVKTDLISSLRESARVGGSWGRRFRAGIVATEVALSLALMVGAGVMFQSLLRLSDVNPGFEPENRLTLGIDLLSLTESEPAEKAAAFERFVSRLEAVPGVISAGAVDRMPLLGSSNHVSYTVDGQDTENQKDNPRTLFKRVSRDYFQAMGIPMRVGERFDAHLATGGPPVAIVNESFAKHHWPGENPVGKRVKLFGPNSEEPWMRIHAVVGDVQHYALDDRVAPAIYVPFSHYPTLRLTWVLHTDGPPANIAASVRDAIREIDPHQPIHDLMPLGELVDRSYWQWRFFSTLFWIFASLAVALSMIGIYGVMSYSVSERTHEVGLRMALGAQKRQVLALMLRQGFSHVLVGLIAGLPLALGLGKILAGELFDVAAAEIGILIAVASLLSLVSLVAMAVPARRAASVNPLESLRYE